MAINEIVLAASPPMRRMRHLYSAAMRVIFNMFSQCFVLLDPISSSDPGNLQVYGRLYAISGPHRLQQFVCSKLLRRES